MSSSTTATVVVRVPTARARLLSEIHALCPDLAHLPRSNLLLSLATTEESAPQRVEPATQVRRLEGRLAALEALPGGLAAVGAASPATSESAKRLLHASRGALVADGDARASDLARRGESALGRALEETASLLAVEERIVAASALEGALVSIGCRVTTSEGEGATGIVAARGNQVVAALIENGGRATLDIAGCDGGECVPFQAEIERALGRSGGSFDEATTVDHGDRRGGALIQAAARAAGPGGDLAAGLVRQKARTAGRFSRASSPARLPERQRLGQGRP